MHYVYFLKSIDENWYYVGSSSDLKQRLNSHKNGEVRSTASKLPVELVYYESYKSVEKARSREQEIKSNRHIKGRIIDRLES